MVSNRSPTNNVCSCWILFLLSRIGILSKCYFTYLFKFAIYYTYGFLKNLNITKRKFYENIRLFPSSNKFMLLRSWIQHPYSWKSSLTPMSLNLHAVIQSVPVLFIQELSSLDTVIYFYLLKVCTLHFYFLYHRIKIHHMRKIGSESESLFSLFFSRKPPKCPIPKIH